MRCVVRAARLGVVAGALWWGTGCATGGGIGTPGFEFRLGGTIVGTGPRDIWWWAPNAQFGSSGQPGDYHDGLWRYNGSWHEVPVPAAVATDPADVNRVARVAAAADGELWLVRGNPDNSLTVIRIDDTGEVIDDRSADIAPFTGSSNGFQLKGGSMGLFLGTPTSTGTDVTWYAYDGGAFVPIAPAPGFAQAVAVVGPDDAYFSVTTSANYTSTTEAYEYAGGTWTPTGWDVAASGGFVLPTADGSTWTAPSNPTELVVQHGSGASWSQIQVTGYTDATTDRTATLWPLAWSVTPGGDLAVLSRWSEPATNGMDWSEQAWVSGTIGVDGAYRDQTVVVPAENCDPTCYNTLSFVDGFGPARLDDGSAVLDQTGEEVATDRTLIVWRP